MRFEFVPFVLLFFSIVCTPEPQAVRTGSVSVGTLFTELPGTYTNIHFQNRLEDSDEFNVFRYRNYYDGGGVGLADFNADGWLDVYFTSNQQENHLYLNKGDFWFEDVTGDAGVKGRHAWTTGVSLADVNGDGWIDIYVCNSGDVPGDSRANELFINQGPRDDGTPIFEEMAAAYGLDDEGYSTHAAFFDYDRDGDLDLYLMNNSSRPISSFEDRRLRDVRHASGGDKLFRNDNGSFIDVSEGAGIYGSEIGFGLSVLIGDVSGDDWPDIYVSNDFFERDYLYINNRDGTFDESLESWMPVISQSSMGADMADVNNDGLPEIYVTDMLPENDRRLKTTSTFDSWQAYRVGIEEGFHHQIMRNMLHLNNGNGSFSEIGQFARISATDWSWSALIADFDLDGYKDIFVSNGIYKDLTNQDFLDFFASEQTIDRWIQGDELDYAGLLAEIPSTPIPNYLFANQGNLTFENKAASWGLATPGFSNGSAYGDLDNDGDLDLVVNNTNMPAFVYRNETDSLLDHRYLQIRLEGSAGNTTGIGARVSVFSQGQIFFQEAVPTHGFQSSVDPLLTFGLGGLKRIDSLVVDWPDGRRQVLKEQETNSRLSLRHTDAIDNYPVPTTASPPLFRETTADSGLDFVHRENDFVDFNRQPLSPRLVSTEGPPIATADVNGDAWIDVFIGGAKDSPGALFIQDSQGSFRRSNVPAFVSDRISEDTGAAFFDADGDGDQDLYVASGGSEFAALAPGLLDRLYINDGRGSFERSTDRLPRSYWSSSRVAPADFDGDGDVDVFVGGRVNLDGYGFPTSSTLLQNDGRGYFTDVTERLAPSLVDAGMVTDACWMDYDRDGRLDLIIAGEWMPITVLRNEENHRLIDATEAAGLAESIGLWNRIVCTDLNGDGDADLVAGNLGLNTKIRASKTEPAMLLVHDFDNNGQIEHILSLSNRTVQKPFVLRKELLIAQPSLENRIPSFAAYAEMSVDDLFTPAQREKAVTLEVNELRTAVMENRGDGTFAFDTLPGAAQWSLVFAILARDFDEDGLVDLLMAGNFDGVKPDLGRMEASYGVYLKGLGQHQFAEIPSRESGIFVPGQTRDMTLIEGPGDRVRIVIARNDDSLKVFEVQ